MNILKDYLQNQQQVVEYNGELQQRNILCGVPQGYINDGTVGKFIDDAAFINTGINLEALSMLLLNGLVQTNCQ